MMLGVWFSCYCKGYGMGNKGFRAPPINVRGSAATLVQYILGVAKVQAGCGPASWWRDWGVAAVLGLIWRVWWTKHFPPPLLLSACPDSWLPPAARSTLGSSGCHHFKVGSSSQSYMTRSSNEMISWRGHASTGMLHNWKTSENPCTYGRLISF